jgi:hypothetical protein
MTPVGAAALALAAFGCKISLAFAFDFGGCFTFVDGGMA